MNYRDEIFMKLRDQASKIVDANGIIADVKRQINDRAELWRDSYEIAINSGKYAIADSDSVEAAVQKVVWMWCEQNGFSYEDRGYDEDGRSCFNIDPWYNYLSTH